MRVDWQQLSPGERHVLVRHFLLKPNAAAVTPEKVCAALQKTHQLTCYTREDGKAVIEFVTKRGVRAVSTAETFTEGIFKAALRAKGVQVEDGFSVRSAARSSARAVAHA